MGPLIYSGASFIYISQTDRNIVPFDLLFLFLSIHITTL